MVCSWKLKFCCSSEKVELEQIDPVTSCLHAGGIGKETDVAAPNLLKCQMEGAIFDPEKPTVTG